MSVSHDNEQFEIIFRGDIQFGQNLVDVKARLQQLFKIDTAKVEALFTGKPVVLKRGLDKVSAEKYQDVLSKAGALIELVSTSASVTKPVASPQKSPQEKSPTNSTPAERSIESSAEAVVSTQWTLAPVGSLMMPTTARLAPVTRQYNLSIYSLRPVGGLLVDKTESRQAEPELLMIPDYKVAEVGVNLIEAGEKIELPVLEIDVEDWGLAEPGTPLLAENEKAPEIAPVISPDYSLAPVGSLLEQIKPQVEIKIPDVSGLKILEN
jgi:hypothetical protein